MPDAVTEQQARQVGEWRNIRYRSWPGGRDYSFTYTLVNGSWRVYINNSPDYRSRASGSIETHRLDIGGRPYICWNQDITTLSAAQAVSSLWADCTERYIAIGRFEPPPNRPTTQDRSVLNGFIASRAATAAHPVDPRPGAMEPAALAHANRSPANTTYRPTAPWHENLDLRLWGGGLAALTLFGLFWVLCMPNGIGFWDVVWAAFAGVGAFLTIRDANARPGGRGWPAAYTVAGALLGFVSLTGRAPGYLWAVVVLLALANAGWYAYAAYRHETSR